MVSERFFSRNQKVVVVVVNLSDFAPRTRIVPSKTRPHPYLPLLQLTCFLVDHSSAPVLLQRISSADASRARFLCRSVT